MKKFFKWFFIVIIFAIILNIFLPFFNWTLKVSYSNLEFLLDLIQSSFSWIFKSIYNLLVYTAFTGPILTRIVFWAGTIYITYKFFPKNKS